MASATKMKVAGVVVDIRGDSWDLAIKREKQDTAEGGKPSAQDEQSCSSGKPLPDFATDTFSFRGSNCSRCFRKGFMNR
jgi:hypothetical protein